MTLDELKQAEDFEVLATYSDGVEHDGPHRCKPGQYSGRVFASGQVWESEKKWVSRGHGVYNVDYSPAKYHAAQPSEEWKQNVKAKALEELEAALKG